MAQSQPGNASLLLRLTGTPAELRASVTSATGNQTGPTGSSDLLNMEKDISQLCALASVHASFSGNQTGSNKSSDLLKMAKDVSQLSMQASIHASRSLSDLISAAAATQSPYTPAYKFLQHLRLCGTCQKFERAGERYDGGYIICADGLGDDTLKGAYSYGISGYDGWGMDMATRYHVPLYEYDCYD